METNIRDNPDGQTLDGYIADKPGFWSAMTFTFRMTTHAERVGYDEAIKEARGALKSDVMCAAIARHIKSWDQTSGDKPVPVSKAAIGLFKNPYLVERLWNIVTGWEQSDRKPSVAGDGRDAAEALIDSMTENLPPAILQQERNEKNSSAD